MKKLPDITWRMGGFLLMPGAGLGKVNLFFHYDREDPAVVMMDIVSRGVTAPWDVSRDVLWNATFNRETSGDGDFVVEPIENVAEIIPLHAAFLKGTLLVHLSSNGAVDSLSGSEFEGDIHEHLVFSRSGMEAFLKETATLVDPRNEDYSPHIDRLLAEILK